MRRKEEIRREEQVLREIFESAAGNQIPVPEVVNLIRERLPRISETAVGRRVRSVFPEVTRRFRVSDGVYCYVNIAIVSQTPTETTIHISDEEYAADLKVLAAALKRKHLDEQLNRSMLEHYLRRDAETRRVHAYQFDKIVELTSLSSNCNMRPRHDQVSKAFLDDVKDRARSLASRK